MCVCVCVCVRVRACVCVCARARLVYVQGCDDNWKLRYPHKKETRQDAICIDLSLKSGVPLNL